MALLSAPLLQRADHNMATALGLATAQGGKQPQESHFEKDTLISVQW